MKSLDLPPLWLVGFAVAARLLGEVTWMGVFDPWGRWLGAGLILTGIVLTLQAAWEFRRHRTTIVPHRTPGALVERGVFRLSRNPIYLADVAILLGLVLWWGVPVALILVPAFAWVIDRRFIRGEEARLAAAFPEGFAAYSARVRRWL